MIVRDKEQWRAAIGPRSEYYLKQFEMFELADRRWVATWNWPAFFFSSAWFAYRRMSGRSLLNFFLPILFIVMIYVLIESELRFLVMAGYLALAFVVIPMYANALYYRHIKAQIARAAASADDKKAKGLLRPPSFVTGTEAFLTAVLAFFIPWLLIVAPAMYTDYTPRSKVSEGVSLGFSLKSPITDFYEEHQRLPAPHEAGKFRVDGGKYTESVVYDAEKKMIVVTVGDPSYLRGKRFAIHAEEKNGKISWNCRTIDLPERDLPPACR